MIIDLASIGKSGRPIQVSFESEEIDIGEGFRLRAGAEFVGDVRRERSKIHLRGHVTAKVEADCFRCLEPVAREIDIRFEDVFVCAEDEVGGSEIELGEEQLDESVLAGNVIDLADVVREQLMLATNETVYCRDDCKGLCPKCGGNRNLIDCKCEEKEIDPRWAALKDFN